MPKDTTQGFCQCCGWSVSVKGLLAAGDAMDETLCHVIETGHAVNYYEYDELGEYNVVRVSPVEPARDEAVREQKEGADERGE